MGAGIEKGFEEAREILAGLEALEGEIASNRDLSYDMVQQGLQAFIDVYTNTDKTSENNEG